MLSQENALTQLPLGGFASADKVMSILCSGPLGNPQELVSQECNPPEVFKEQRRWVTSLYSNCTSSSLVAVLAILKLGAKGWRSALEQRVGAKGWSAACTVKHYTFRSGLYIGHKGSDETGNATK
jgi:hypothetical protein